MGLASSKEAPGQKFEDARKLVFFGNERLANSVQESGIILQTLLDEGYEVTSLVVNQSKIQGRKKPEDAVTEIARANNIPIITEWDQDKIIDIAKQNDAGVLASFGRIIRSEVIDAFPRGIINIHPSLLPKYRGPTPIESAILGGDKLTGVSLMSLTHDLDAGNIFGAAEQSLQGNESKQEVYDLLSGKGTELLKAHLPDILSGKNTGKAQHHDDATFTKLIIKSDGDIDWDQPAEVIEREIRAFLDWPGSHVPLAGKDVVLTKVRLSDTSGTPGEYEAVDREIVMNCGTGSLVIEMLKPAGRAEMSSEAFLAGNPL